MAHQSPDLDPALTATVRSIVLPAQRISLELKSIILQHVGLCECTDCVGIRAKLSVADCVLTMQEAAIAMRALVNSGTDSSLELAGKLCHFSGESFMARIDLTAKACHMLEQSHAYLRGVIEAKRLLVWFHEELHKVTSKQVIVAGFPLHTDDGIIRFDKDTRMRVKAAAVEFAKRAGLPKKD